MRRFDQILHSSIEHYLVIKNKLTTIEQDNDFQSENLNARTAHRTYLITYSQKVPSCKDFGRLVKNAFNRGSSKIKVLHWACCLEDHQDHGKTLPSFLEVIRSKKVETNERGDHEKS